MAKKRTQKESLYLSVVTLDNGSACLGQFVETQTPDSTVITTKNKSTGKESKKNYVLFDEIEGKLTRVGVFDKELDSGAKWEETFVTVENLDGTLENVQTNFRSNFSSSFITRLENIDISKPVIIRAFRIKDKTKKNKDGSQKINELLIPYQKNEIGELVSVKNKYAPVFVNDDKTNNLNPNKLPEFRKLEKIVKGAKVVEYETSEYEEALRQICLKVDKNIRELKRVTEFVAEVEQTTPTVKNEVNIEDNDDLPF
jgi:hypothetical protein